MLTESDVPARVVKSLQVRIDSTVLGSLEHDTAEYAIEYALSPRRNPSNEIFFLRDVLRDARKSILRHRKRETKLVENVIGKLSPSVRFNDIGILASCRNEAGYGVVDNCTPEAIFLARELEERIREQVSRLGSLALRCFEDMLAGESLRQTAEALRVSERTVNRYRQAIREVTRKILEEDKAAQKAASA